MKVTPLIVFYGLFTVAGAVIPWYFNLRFMRESGEMLTPQRWLAEGFATSLMGSVTSDFLIGTLPVLVWMVVEARRLALPWLLTLAVRVGMEAWATWRWVEVQGGVMDTRVVFDDKPHSKAKHAVASEPVSQSRPSCIMILP